MGLCPFSVQTCLFSSKNFIFVETLNFTDMRRFTQSENGLNSVVEKEKTSREVLGKFFYDLAKIAFTGLVVGNALAIIIGEEKWLYGAVIAIGILGTYLFARIGYNIIKS